MKGMLEQMSRSRYQDNLATPRVRRIATLLAGVIVCFQLTFANHIYSHPLDQAENFCQACLLSHHGTPPALSAAGEVSPPVFSIRSTFSIAAPMQIFLRGANGPRAPPVLFHLH